jgi:hypothetical protein
MPATFESIASGIASGEAIELRGLKMRSPWVDMIALCNTIDLSGRDFSLAVVVPRTSYFQWLAAFAARKGLDPRRLHAPEEDAVVVIPSTQRFSEPGSLGQFIDAIKPKLLASELARVLAEPSDVPHPITSEAFDMYFELIIRDSVLFLSDLT